MQDFPEINLKDKNTWQGIWEVISKSWLLITVLSFTALAKIYTMLGRKDISKWEFIIELCLSLVGSSLAFYLILDLKWSRIWLAIITALVGICIAQLSKVLAQKSTPIFEEAAEAVRQYIRKKGKEN